ncbi:MAG: dethiobiotin synthase [Bacteroidetes bacterium]|jgi:dethiobiotin synthetase|nr:dethiobiotin synthase [Bacteroidota bacterium]
MIYPEKLFVTGTDTKIGKTVVSSILAAGLEASYWKPVQTGSKPITDTEFVKKHTGLPGNHFYDEVYRFSSAMSPHAAAQMDGVEIDMAQFNPPKYYKGHLIVEGAGGLIEPLNRDKYIIDLIQELHLPVLLVGKSGLGTLNHILLSLEALRARHIQVWGVVLVGEKNHSNEEAVIQYGNVDRLFHLGILENFEPQTLRKAFHRYLTTPLNEQ